MATTKMAMTIPTFSLIQNARFLKERIRRDHDCPLKARNHQLHPGILLYYIMHKLGVSPQRVLFSLGTKINGTTVLQNFEGCGSLFPDRKTINWYSLKATTFMTKEAALLRSLKIKSSPAENIGKLLEDDEDEVCPVDCVREFKTDEEFLGILEKAKETNALVVVDFYRTSCGSCKYIEQGFIKLCKGSGEEEAPVIFLKHNVLDEYDEQSEVAERLRIRSVPLFHFYKNGVLLEAFPTRDKERILGAILKYTSSASRQVESIS